MHNNLNLKVKQIQMSRNYATTNDFYFNDNKVR